jgi:hypothetical protein
MTGIEFVEALTEDPEAFAQDIADWQPAVANGWLTSPDVCEVRLADGRRLLVTVQEV